MNMVLQLSVFIENREGHLASICRTLADAGINMRALFLADTADFGVARIFCDTPRAAEDALKSAGFRARVIPVLGVRVPDRQGGLAELLEYLDSQKVNVEYGYCFSVDSGYAIDVLKVSDPEIEKRLVEVGYELVKDEDIYEID